MPDRILGIILEKLFMFTPNLDFLFAECEPDKFPTP
jgi:hypothetical protein